MSLQIEITGTEALEMIQAYYPKTWEQKIEEGKQLIKRAMRIFKCDSIEAYQRFRTKGGSPASAIVTLAALQIMNKNYAEWSVAKLQKEQNRCIEQLGALENSTLYDSETKTMLRQYYCGKQNEYAERLNQLILAIPVIDAQPVVYQIPLEFGKTG